VLHCPGVLRQRPGPLKVQCPSVPPPMKAGTLEHENRLVRRRRRSTQSHLDQQAPPRLTMSESSPRGWAFSAPTSASRCLSRPSSGRRAGPAAGHKAGRRPNSAATSKKPQSDLPMFCMAEHPSEVGARRGVGHDRGPVSHLRPQRPCGRRATEMGVVFTLASDRAQTAHVGSRGPLCGTAPGAGFARDCSNRRGCAGWCRPRRSQAEARRHSARGSRGSESRLLRGRLDG
jgi:hypothetical protein